MPVHPLRQPAHYLFTLPALAVALALWAATPATEVGSAGQHILPWLLACLGVGLAIAYHQMRALCLLLVMAASAAVLHDDVGHYLRHGDVAALTPLRFHAVSTWLPLLFAGHAVWPERGRRRRDLLLRTVITGAALGLFLLLASQQPQAMHDLLSNRHLAWLPAGWSALAQLPALLFLLATGLLGWQAWRRPRPLHTAMLLALLCLWWMLPRIFLQPALLPAASVAALLLVLAAMLQESFHMAFRDELTGLPGRRAFNACLQRAGGTFSVAMVDVDHFKHFNDTHGHDAGDDVLRLVAARLARVGDGGQAFRYGGEEFALVFLDRPAQACTGAVEQLRATIAACPMQLRDRSTRSQDDALGQQQRGHGGNGAKVQVTVSIGLADSRGGRSPAAVVKAADQALYAAKAQGRNRVQADAGARQPDVRATDAQTASR
ncbi:GGDEF domain-containing protein [Stenotrophomonas sp. 24(2023)]|uniref:GGDEF domain-containing protein n=1 Tax=Stenotrophomonas sp. 24(2023) TaxID=3068324 RepID=UPI0027DFD178|nr:GGDEF domain-containing protein [Stenotrophomonas sp. 24(2023)]WMJ71032.1 GGDEF domain-containing protein [Stenotrophomonas sp. 24(2023)]